MQIIDTSAIDSLDIPTQQKEILRGQVIAAAKADQQSFFKEYNRYKQDCRKRALDLAHSRLPHITNEGDWVPTNADILKLADEHYKWLIEIPEK